MSVVILLLLLAGPAFAKEPCSNNLSHKVWAEQLERFVHDGTVNYRAWAAEEPALARYLDDLKALCPETYTGWNSSSKMAYWINAYNALTVSVILDNYPLKSIRSIGLLPGSVWRRKLFNAEALGRSLSLNDMEHGILRREFDEPRVHFALVCASKSCPILRSFTAEILDQQLGQATRAFLADETRNSLDDGGSLRLSRIFQWFEDDFGGRDGVRTFVRTWGPDSWHKAIDSDANVEFLEYDWSLNQE